MIPNFISKYAARALGGLSLLLMFLLVMASLLASHFHQRLDQCRVDAKAQIAEYERVYRETFQAHLTAKLIEDARRSKITMEANNATQPSRDAALNDAAAYRTTHRCVLRAPAGVDPTGKPGLPVAAADPGSSQAPGAAPELVGITATDHDNCSLNSADLDTAVQWAQRLNP